MKYLLEFQDEYGDRKNYGYYNTISEAKKEMFNLIKNMYFKCLYTREIKRDDCLWIDFGKHHEFFRIYDIKEGDDE